MQQQVNSTQPPRRRGRGELIRMFDKQNSVKHLFERQTSSSCDVSTVGTDVCSYSSLESSIRQRQPVEKKVRAVHFGCDEDSDDESVQCEIRFVEKITDFDLWWQPEETYEIRSECLEIVQDSQDDPDGISFPTVRFLEYGWKEGVAGSQHLLNHMMVSPETRGLEFYIIPGASDRTRDHVQDILIDQMNGVSAQSLSAAARQASRPCLRLALLRARYDVEAAKELSTYDLDM